jgi:serpin B
MRRLMMILFTGAMISGICTCSAQDTPSVPSSSVPRITDPDVGETDLLELASGNSTFAFNLYKAIKDNNDNIFFSPYSISAALAMTYAGAEGITEIEMAEVLQFPRYENRIHSAFNMLDQNLTAAAGRDSTFSLHIVNALWGQTGYTFLPEFLEILAANYGAGISLLEISSPVTFSPQPRGLCLQTLSISRRSGSSSSMKWEPLTSPST